MVTGMHLATASALNNNNGSWIQVLLTSIMLLLAGYGGTQGVRIVFGKRRRTWDGQERRKHDYVTQARCQHTSQGILHKVDATQSKVDLMCGKLDGVANNVDRILDKLM